MADTGAPPGRERYRVAAVALATLAATALFFAAGLGSHGTYDTFRDLWFAELIRQGIEYPLVGPGINRTFHLGPVWYYLVAAATALGNPVVWLTLLCAVLVALKFPLAFALGTRLHGRGLGIAFAAVLALPGWWLHELAVLTHTVAVETALLLTGLTALRLVERPGAWRALQCGVAAALALHAHPTTLPLVGALCLWAAYRCARERAFLGLALLPVPLALALAPYAASGALAADLAQIGAYVGTIDASAGLLPRAADLAVAVAFGGAFHFSYLWLGLPMALAVFVTVVCAGTPLVAATLGAASGMPPRLRMVAGVALLAFAMQLAFLVVVRDVTPSWMAFSLLPPYALALAACLLHAWTRSGWMRWPIAGALLAAHAVSVSLVLWLASAPSSLWIPTYAPGSAGAMEIGQWPTGRVRIDVPPLSLGAVAAAFDVHECGRVQLHGTRALLAERTLGVPWLHQCGDSGGVWLGGRARSDAGEEFAYRDAAAGGCDAGDARVERFEVVAPTDGVALGDPHRYPPRSVAPRIEPHRLTVPVGAMPLLSVSDLLPDYLAVEGLVVEVEGRRVQPLPTDGVQRGFRCVDCSPDDAWSIAYTGDARYLDVVRFACTGRTDAGTGASAAGRAR